MRVDQKLTALEYAKAKKYVAKAVGAKGLRSLGDQVLVISASGRASMHPDYVHVHELKSYVHEPILLSEHFYYFGRNAIELPPDLAHVLVTGRGHRRRDGLLDELVEFLETNCALGRHGDPLDCPIDLTGKAATCVKRRKCIAQ